MMRKLYALALSWQLYPFNSKILKSIREISAFMSWFDFIFDCQKSSALLLFYLKIEASLKKCIAGLSAIFDLTNELRS